MTAEDCQCGHGRLAHRKSGCVAWVPDPKGNKASVDFDTQLVERGRECFCAAFDNSIPPAPGERLEFGKHRVKADDAESAPAWPPLR